MLKLGCTIETIKIPDHISIQKVFKYNALYLEKVIYNL